MVVNDEALLARDFFLLRFYALVKKLGDIAAGNADHVVVVRFVVEFKHRAAAFKLVADDQARVLQLRQHAVDGGQADGLFLFQQDFVDILGRHVAHRAVLQHRQHLQARAGGF